MIAVHEIESNEPWIYVSTRSYP